MLLAAWLMMNQPSEAPPVPTEIALEDAPEFNRLLARRHTPNPVAVSLNEEPLNTRAEPSGNAKVRIYTLESRG